MQDKNMLSVSNFARIAQTTRSTLIYYDKIGLLKPVHRSKTGYRYYSVGQLAAVNLIRTCQSSGIPLHDIQELAKYRTPAIMRDFFGEQIKQIDNAISEQLRTRKLFVHFKQMIGSALEADIGKISVLTLPEEAIVLGEINDYSADRNDYDALLSFYKASQEKYPGIDMNYPVWGFFTEESVKNGNCDWPDRYYFNNPDGRDKKQKALYAVCCGKGGYGDGNELFERVLNYTHTQGYEVCGPAYCEYPLNEISVTNPSQYLTRLLITVKKI